jgi:hypothetical protein
MKTAVEELIEYFVKQQKEGCSHWCIHDLIAQLYVAKLIEIDQMRAVHMMTYMNKDFDFEQYLKDHREQSK